MRNCEGVNEILELVEVERRKIDLGR